MATCFSSPKPATSAIDGASLPSSLRKEAEIALLTGGFDKPYVFGLAMALISQGVCLDLIGSDEVDSPELHEAPGLNFLKLRGSKQVTASPLKKIARVLVYYARLIRYATISKSKIFHILWNNKFELFDRTLLILFYKLLGKKIVLTAHNVNAGKRDGNDSFLNRLSLKIQYRLADRIFIHTEKMKSELLGEFGIREEATTVIPFGINNSVPNTNLTCAEARQRLGIGPGEKAILFFGAIRPYKGLEHLVAAFQRLAPLHPEYRLIIAGEPKKESVEYLQKIQNMIATDSSGERVIQKIEFVPDSETELYFKAADVSVLPYTHVFQSGVLFLSYRFGLPVIASDIGSFHEDVVAGRTGYLHRPCNPADLAAVLERYFDGALYKRLDDRRQEIQDYANRSNSWNTVGEITRNVYQELLGAPECTSAQAF